MAIVRMQKVAIYTHSSCKEEVIDALHGMGVLHIVDAGDDATEIDHSMVRARAADVEYTIDTLKDFASKETLAACAKPSSEEEIRAASSTSDVRGIVEELRALEESDTELQRLLQQATAVSTTVQPWIHARYACNAPKNTQHSAMVYGSIEVGKYQQLPDVLQKNNIAAELEKVSEDAQYVYCIAHVLQSNLAAFEAEATVQSWTSITFPEEYEGMPADLFAQATLEQEKYSKQIEANKRQRETLSAHLPQLMRVRAFITWLDEKQEAREAMADSAQTSVLHGWIAKKKQGKLEQALHAISPATHVTAINAEKGEEPPVLLQNSKLVTPFESVTTLYGLPLPSEFDPTQSLAPFFIVFFALCLTDAGYGLVLAILFGIYLWKSKQTIAQAPLWWLIFFGGIATFIAGIFFGGWFGLSADQVPAALTKTVDITLDSGVTVQQTWFKGQIWNLTQKSGILFLMYTSLILGLTHIFYGMFLAGWHKFIHGQKAAAFWEDFTSHLLLGSILFLAFAPESATQAATYLLYVVLVITIWGKGYGSPWYLRPIMGTLGLVNFAISILSNGLSYLRILALGLVTGSLAGAVNQVALALGGLLPIWAGIPVIIVIFLIGHLVSIALNTLGTFIHAGRLQFIEFFGQFFEGGGKAFSPFKRSSI